MKNNLVGIISVITFTSMKKIEVTFPQPTEDDISLVELLADGKTGEDIAKELKLNKNTLAFNLSVLRSKYDCSNTMALVVFFLRNKLID